MSVWYLYASVKNNSLPLPSRRRSMQTYTQTLKKQSVFKGLILFYCILAISFGSLAINYKSLWVFITLFIIFFLFTEFISRLLIHRFFPIFNDLKNNQLEVQPHIFTHFIPSESNPNISNGFRRTSPPNSSLNTKKEEIYLAGDCIVYEGHLPSEESLAFKLQALSKKYKVLNAGVSHYTLLHCYNRFVVDLLSGSRPKKLILFATINDVLSFIHHKNGLIRPDHTHLYKPWTTNSQLRNLLLKCPFSTLKLFLCILFFGKKSISHWGAIAQEISPIYFQPKSYLLAKKLFNPNGFNTCLKLFHGTCKTYDIELILTTIRYKKEDMIEEPRKTYAWGIDMLNNEIRTFAKANSIHQIDIAKLFHDEPQDIENKWHHTDSGNSKRAEIIFKNLFERTDTLSK